MNQNDQPVLKNDKACMTASGLPEFPEPSPEIESLLSSEKDTQ